MHLKYMSGLKPALLFGGNMLLFKSNAELCVNEPAVLWILTELMSPPASIDDIGKSL